jgi:hypothetical protein
MSSVLHDRGTRLPEPAAPSVVAPVGADLRVVARVRMVTPARRVANLRVAMRVQVTEQDEDLRSLTRAIQRALRALLIVAMMATALTRGAVRRVAHALAPAPAPVPVALTRITTWPIVVESERIPRPALASSVIPSPD